MLINGRWLICNDGVVRPVIPGSVQDAGGGWEEAEFLVDTGADRTAFGASVLRVLGLSTVAPQEQLAGVGGAANSVLVDTTVQFIREGGAR